MSVLVAQEGVVLMHRAFANLCRNSVQRPLAHGSHNLTGEKPVLLGALHTQRLGRAPDRQNRRKRTDSARPSSPACSTMAPVASLSRRVWRARCGPITQKQLIQKSVPLRKKFLHGPLPSRSRYKDMRTLAIALCCLHFTRFITFPRQRESGTD